MSEASKPTITLPRWGWIAGGAALLVIVAVVVLFVPPLAVAQRIDGSSMETLTLDSPDTYHPDGLAVSLVEGDSVRVGIAAIPQQAFLDDQAGQNWVQARTVLPANYDVISPLYTIETRGEGSLAAVMAVPNNAEPHERVDLFRWDDENGAWRFVPAELDSARGFAFDVEGETMHVLAARAMPVSLTAGVMVSPGAENTGGNYGITMLEGVSISAAGELTGEPVASDAAVMWPVVANRSGGLTDYSGLNADSALVQELVSLATAYDGLALDFSPGAGYIAFVDLLQEQLHAESMGLHVILRGEEVHSTDLVALGQATDRVWIAPGDDPLLYLPDGAAQDMLNRAVDHIWRRHPGLLVSGLTVDVSGSATQPLSFEEAAARFGDVQTVAGYVKPDAPLVVNGSDVAFSLNSSVEAMGYDPAVGMNYITYREPDSGLHYVYFGSPQGLSFKLDGATQYALDSVLVHGIAHPDAPHNIENGLTAFLVEQQINAPEALSLVWRVEDSAGAALREEAGDLSLLQYLWQATVEPGEYRVAALLRGDQQESQRGEVVLDVIAVTEEPTPTPTPEVTATPTQAATTPPSQATQPPATTPPPATTQAPPPPAPAGGAGSDGGPFELGGQVPGYIAHPDQMRQSGMSWVKFQVGFPGNPADAAGLINAGHAQGFKVLLSVKGPLYPTSIDYAGYTEFVRQVASYGPDAIEVWNEMNLNREWPEGQIDPAAYVNNMLAPAFNAIKSVSPGTMVIIGALAPTGVDDGVRVWSDQRYIQGLAAAGAANYANCLGVHHNAGATSPSQSSGHPAGGHYSWYFQPTINVYYNGIGGALPLCFTEYGYVSPEGYGPLPGNFAWGSDNTVAEQAAWLAEGVQIARSLGYIRLMIIWNVDFTVWADDDPQAGYAIIRPGGGCPACATLGQAMQ